MILKSLRTQLLSDLFSSNVGLLLPFAETRGYVPAIRRARACTIVLLCTEICATGGAVFCFGVEGGLQWGAILIATRVACNVAGSVAANHAAAAWSLALEKLMGLVTPIERILHSLLSEQGLSEEDLQHLRRIPQDAYALELQCAPRTFWLSIGSPLACSLALCALNEWVWATVIFIIGMLAVPIGELLYTRFAVPGDRLRRMGSSSGDTQQLESAYVQQQRLAVAINVISQMPMVLFVTKLAGGSATLFASFWALTQGLVGLSGMMAFQRLRILYKRSNRKIETMLTVLAQPPFLFSDKARTQHICCHWPHRPVISGVHFLEMAPHTFGRGTRFSLSGSIKGGSIGVIEARSGAGKSLMLFSIQRLLAHVGHMGFADATGFRDLHELDTAEVKQKILHLSLDQLPSGKRIVDLFVRWLPEHIQQLMCAENMLQVVRSCEDSLLEDEIGSLESGQPSMFKPEHLALLKELRHRRTTWVQTLLRQEEGHLNHPGLTPCRSVDSLSSGERQSLLGLLAKTASTCTQLSLLIIDEPFAHLDVLHQQVQAERLRTICNQRPDLSVLIITHGFTDELAQTVPNTNKLRVHEGCSS